MSNGNLTTLRVRRSPITCARCGKHLTDGAWLYSTFSKNHFCVDIDACSRRTKRHTLDGALLPGKPSSSRPQGSAPSSVSVTVLTDGTRRTDCGRTDTLELQEVYA